MTFGVKLCSWIDILERQRDNFEHALEQIRVGQISGPVGTYSNISPEVEKLPAKSRIEACQNFNPGNCTRLSRLFMQSLALIASVLEQFATEIRHLQRTEVLEVEEGLQKAKRVRQQCRTRRILFYQKIFAG